MFLFGFIFSLNYFRGDGVYCKEDKRPTPDAVKSIVNLAYLSYPCLFDLIGPGLTLLKEAVTIGAFE